MPIETDRAVARYIKDRRTSGGIRPSTAADYGYILAGFAKCCPADPRRINRRSVRRWLDEQTCSPSTLRSRLSAVRSFCDWLVAEGLITRSPVRSMNLRVRTERRRIPRSFAPADASRIYGALPDARADCIVTLGLQLGLRCSEIVGLEIHDIDWTRREVHIHHAKNGNERVIPLTEEAGESISRYLAEYPAADGPLIRSYVAQHRGLTSGHVSHLVVAWLYEAGLKRSAYDGRSLHALRHTALTDMLDHSRDLAAVADVAGHASISTTRDLYTRRARADVLRPVMEGRRYNVAF